MNRNEQLKNVWKVEGNEVSLLSVEYDVEKTDLLIDTLMKTKNSGHRIFTSGTGTSAAAAKKIAHTFCCIDFPAMFLSPSDSLHGGLGTIQKSDVVILISKGGSTNEITSMIDGIKQKHAIIVGVTENADSMLGKSCDILVLIHISSEPDMFNMLATASTMKVVAYFDAIIVILMVESEFTREQFALIHPNGAVGDRLLGRKL